MAALNRTYALAKANGNVEAIVEAEKLNLIGNYLYHSLLGNLYMNVDKSKAVTHFTTALTLSKSSTDKILFSNKIADIERGKVD